MSKYRKILVKFKDTLDDQYTVYIFIFSQDYAYFKGTVWRHDMNEQLLAVLLTAKLLCKKL